MNGLQCTKVHSKAGFALRQRRSRFFAFVHALCSHKEHFIAVTVGIFLTCCCFGLHADRAPTPPKAVEENALLNLSDLPSTEGYDALQEILDDTAQTEPPNFSKEAQEFIANEHPLASEHRSIESQQIVTNAPETTFRDRMEVIPQAKPSDQQREEQPKQVVVDLVAAFTASPLIYSLLLGMSIIAVCTWLYILACMKKEVPASSHFYQDLETKLTRNAYDEALLVCQNREELMCKMLSSGIICRRHGLPVILETMKTEGKRSSAHFWQKINILNDIAVIAPLLGLLGTVLGMFYAFYDVNRSAESVSMLFDGLGVSVGTTVAGLIVSIIALLLHSTAKYRLMSSLIRVENDAQMLASLIESRVELKG